MKQIDIAPWLEKLRHSGYRLTESRRALLAAVAGCDYAFTVPQLLEMAQAIDPEIGKATVYRTVETLEALGLIHRVHDLQGCHKYCAVHLAPKPLLICQACGCSAPLEDGALQQFFAQLAREHSITIKSYWLQLNGLCANCC